MFEWKDEEGHYPSSFLYVAGMAAEVEKVLKTRDAWTITLYPTSHKLHVFEEFKRVYKSLESAKRAAQRLVARRLLKKADAMENLASELMNF